MPGSTATKLASLKAVPRKGVIRCTLPYDKQIFQPPWPAPCSLASQGGCGQYAAALL